MSIGRQGSVNQKGHQWGSATDLYPFSTPVSAWLPKPASRSALQRRGAGAEGGCASLRGLLGQTHTLYSISNRWSSTGSGSGTQDVPRRALA